MPDRIAGLRGMRKFSREQIKLRAGDYIRTELLPSLPRPPFGHVSNAAPGGDWGMLANGGPGAVGNCVLAGGMHEEMHWANSTKKPIPVFNDDIARRQYFELSGGKDVGLDPVEVARHRRLNGIKDVNGTAYKIESFALIDSLRELEYTSYLFDLAGVGAYMPRSAERDFNQHRPWTDTHEDPNPSGGHYFCVLGKNSVGLWIAVTWRQLQGISDAWLDKYCFGCGGGALAYFSRNYLKETGRSPELFDENQLVRDLAQITNLPHYRNRSS